MYNFILPVSLPITSLCVSSEKPLQSKNAKNMQENENKSTFSTCLKRNKSRRDVEITHQSKRTDVARITWNFIAFVANI